MNIANLVQQKLVSDSPADLLLGTVVPSFITMSAAFQDGDKVFYSLRSGNDREIGYGTYNSGPNSITRDTLFEQVVSGVYDDTPATPIAGVAGDIVSCSPSIQGLTTHLPVWKRFPVHLGGPEGAYSVSAPGVAAVIGGIEQYQFDAAAIENVSVLATVPHDIEENTDLVVEVHWMPTSADTGLTRWGLEYFILSIEGSVLSATTIAAEKAGEGAANQHLVASFPAIVMPEPGAQLIGRLYRDATHVNDTYTDDATLLNVTGKYQASRLGTPNGVPNFYLWS